jgi:hypothetical protein
MNAFVPQKDADFTDGPTRAAGITPSTQLATNPAE